MSQRTTAYLSKVLRQHAHSNGWPRELAWSLGVNHHDGHFSVVYPPHHEDSVMDLEYGTPDRPPMGTIRQFLNRSDAVAEPMLAQEEMQYLESMGVL